MNTTLPALTLDVPLSVCVKPLESEINPSVAAPSPVNAPMLVAPPFNAMSSRPLCTSTVPLLVKPMPMLVVAAPTDLR